MQCDHCESDMDVPVQGFRGDYCSLACYYAEEQDDPTAHDDAEAIEQCPGCNGGEHA